MTKNEHVLLRSDMAGNGYHGNCMYCGLDLTTDLGFSSWAGVKCVDREITDFLDIPKKIREYAKYRGLHWDNANKTFNRAYSEETFTIDELNEKLQAIELALIEQ